MERWDFDCQKCGRNIGDAWDVDSEWYQCVQDRWKYQLLANAFWKYIQKNCSNITFDDEGNITGGTLPTDERVLREIKECIRERIREKGCSEIHGRIFIYIDFEKKIAWWSPKDESGFSEENYQRAGLINHRVQGRGWGYVGYCFCEECAKSLGYKCPLCGSKLEKVTADQHPGGHWGIRDVREHASMA